MNFKTDTHPIIKYTDLQTKRIMECLDTLVSEAKTIHCYCGKELSFNHVDMYDHSGGWGLIGEIPKQWLSVHCDHCGYDMSFSKLGVAR